MRLLLLLLAIPLLYGLHRLCLRLEEQGYLYYWRQKPKPGGASPFLMSQELFQPQVRHVIEAESHRAEKAEDDRHTPQPFDPVRRRPAEERSVGDDPASE